MKHLFNEFNPASASEWKVRLEKDLKGITFEELSVKDRNGITIHPFYTSEDVNVEYSVVTSNPDWSICEQIVTEDASVANKQALEALNNGASGISFIIKNDVEIAALLQNIELPYIYCNFKINNSETFLTKFQDYLQSKNWKLNCFISNDFVGNYLETNEWNKEPETNAFLSTFETTKQLSIDASLFQNAGCNSVTELAYALAQINEYLNILNENNKVSLLQKVHISIATDTNFYEQIAKLRALKNVLHLLLEQYGLKNIPVHLHVETSNVYRSPFDSYSNLLRDTLAGMAGVLGSCDSLYIHPFDETLRTSTDFSKRMSRNQQLIFKEESYLDKVADIAAGSYYLETLTAQLSEKAWSSFKGVEANGGLIAIFENGDLKKTIETQAQQLIQEYKEGKRILIGVNKFINATDSPKPLVVENHNAKGIQRILLSSEIL
ncbi:hypothetical protein F0919_01030 [Taibaiella lutea]|uniref:Methylmalonyl-CoA mutase alpha/beta chain catalytic domain-containing protein n=1 Tax=Taibaiella lutea TaxID=2608001 RepID=A0A5M6CM36_9BACT|nr:methylmalonyl-CoA mutase family protein [Taibaiella lutea]KAA5536281.1 hypothetical protein F0919_01030 [Taibaiella lutea]